MQAAGRSTYDAEGKITSNITVLVDISERKRVEALRELSRAVEQSLASIIITDPAGSIEYVNPKFTEVTEYSEAEVLATRRFGTRESAPAKTRGATGRRPRDR